MYYSLVNSLSYKSPSSIYFYTLIFVLKVVSVIRVEKIKNLIMIRRNVNRHISVGTIDIYIPEDVSQN